METYRTEEEQLAALKNWWKKNSTSILVSAVLVVVAIFGWQSWQENQRLSNEDASELYFTLLEAVALKDDAQTSTIKHLVTQLQENHSSRVYTQYAGLLAAKQALLTNDFKLAEKQLNWVIENAKKGSSLYNIALVRLARVIAIGGGESDILRALALVENVIGGAHLASFEEIKGDLYLALGRESDARNAYQAAVDASSASNSNNRLFLNIKLHDLAVVEER